MNTYAVMLHPRGPLASKLTSDMLFGAVCSGIAALHGKLDLPLDTPGAAPFVFSGIFPVWAPSEKPVVRFYPRPATFSAQLSPSARAVRSRPNSSIKNPKDIAKKVSAELKKLREVEFFSEKCLIEAVSGRLTPTTLISSRVEGGSDYEFVGKVLLVHRSELNGWPFTIDPKTNERRYLHFMKKHDTQHNQIDRVTGGTGEGLLFYESETFFSENGRLWALLRTTPQTLADYVMPALRYLQDTGLGANRTAGKGQFDITVGEAPNLPDAGARANAFLSLSRYLPMPGELGQSGPMAYELASLWPKREHKFPQSQPGSSTGAPVYKRRMRVFEPGSVFPLGQRREYYGQAALLVREDEGAWNVYQSGFTLPLFLRIEEEGGSHGA